MNQGDQNKNIGSSYGREITSIAKAKEELWHKPKDYDPTTYIDEAAGDEYWGINQKTQEAIYLPKDAVNHVLLCGITRSGKGVFSGVKSLETIRAEKGLIYIDVKQEEWIPAIIKEELEKQGRANDLHIANWPNDFCYSGLNHSDTTFEIYEKILEALDLKSADSSASQYYQIIEKMTLFNAIEAGYNTHFRAEWYEILAYITALADSVDTLFRVQEELNSREPNFDFIEKARMAFPKEFIQELHFGKQHLGALNSLRIKIFELISGANITSEISLDAALYENKVIYIKADMLNQNSLKLLKILFIDLANKARKKKANTLIIADEISFYATSSLAAQLATMAGFGVRLLLQLQDIGQIPENLRAPILTNCSIKLFYKISDPMTLDYVKTLAGEELVTSFATVVQESKTNIRIQTEPLLNATRVRAMWFQRQAILIAEYLWTAFFIETAPVKVSAPFDWNAENSKVVNRPVKKLPFHFKVFESKADFEVDEKEDGELM